MGHKFQIDLRGIIDLLSEHLYSGPEVFVRELLQNAVDAITARGQLDPAHTGDILVEVHTPRGKPPTICYTDNGVGLTPDEVHTFLATIGQSSKRAAKGARPTDFIGQFGIGILSCFVVSDEIVVVSRSAREATPAVEWRAKADGTYTLKELDRDLEPGTQVWLAAKEGSEDHFAPDRIRDLCRHYGALLPYPIKVASGKATTVVNKEPPPWRQTLRGPKEQAKAFLAYGREVFGLDFFDAIPLKSEAGKVDGVGFVLPFPPGHGAKHRHRVYLKNMFLSDAADNLLPEWAFFVQAVVNADDLRPTASRESFYEDRKLASARDALGGCLRTYLMQLAEHRPERLEEFLNIHHRALKALAAEDEEFYRIIIDYLPFETSLGQMTFGEYRAANDRVRFVTDVDSFRQIAPVAAAQNLCVINAGYTYDAELLVRAEDVFEDLTVESVDPTALAQSFDELSLDEQDVAEPLLRVAEQALKPFRCGADARKFLPTDLPALFSANAEARFYRSLEQSKEVANPLWSGVLDNLRRQDRAAAGARLCFNFNNPLVRKLVAVADSKRLGRAVQMLYVQALLLGHHPLGAAELRVLNDGLLAMVGEAMGEAP